MEFRKNISTANNSEEFSFPLISQIHADKMEFRKNISLLIQKSFFPADFADSRRQTGV
jgi:hypothetical protein